MYAKISQVDLYLSLTIHSGLWSIYPNSSWLCGQPTPPAMPFYQRWFRTGLTADEQIHNPK